MSEETVRDLSVFLPTLEVGGAERVAVNLCNALSSRGVSVELVLVSATGSFLRDVDPLVTVVDLGCRRGSNEYRTALPPLRRYLRRRRPTLLLSELTHANVIAVVARDLARVDTRVVVSEHNTMSICLAQRRSIYHSILPWLMRYAYRRADGVVAVSEGVRRDLEESFGIATGTIDVVYNPIVTPGLLESRRATPHPWLDDQLEDRLEDGGAPVVVAAGRLTRQKDYPTLLRAVALVRAERPVRLLILGEGEERPQIEALVSELGLDDDVAMPGNVEHPASSVSRAAVYVLSSTFEGLPSVLIEALPWGVPIIATDCPSGPSEILAEGRHGRLVPVGDSAALAAAIVDALDGRIAPPGPDAWAPFTIEAVTDRYLSVLGAVLRR